MPPGLLNPFFVPSGEMKSAPFCGGVGAPIMKCDELLRASHARPGGARPLPVGFRQSLAHFRNLFPGRRRLFGIEACFLEEVLAG